MKIKEYLLKQDAVSLKYVATKMYPNNKKGAAAYLNVKLKGTDPRRQWTEADEAKSRQVLHDLGIELQGL